MDSSKRHYNQIICGVRNTIVWLERKNVHINSSYLMSEVLDLWYPIKSKLPENSTLNTNRLQNIFNEKIG
jgi:hypothetical protein